MNENVTNMLEHLKRLLESYEEVSFHVGQLKSQVATLETKFGIIRDDLALHHIRLQDFIKSSKATDPATPKKGLQESD